MYRACSVSAEVLLSFFTGGMVVPPPNTKGWTFGWIATEPIPGTGGAG